MDLTPPPAKPVTWACAYRGIRFRVSGAYQTAFAATHAASRWLCEVAGVLVDTQSPELRVFQCESPRVVVRIGDEVIPVSSVTVDGVTWLEDAA